MSRIEFFDNRGQKVSEIIANTNRSWVMNGHGRCLFDVPTNSAKCTEDNLQFGNFVYIGHDKLPAWGGVIDTPREWGRHKVSVCAYSGEYIFNYRRTESIINVDSSPGNIFKRILSIANREGDTHIRAGAIELAGNPLKWELNLLRCYDEIIRLAEETDSEFRLRAKTLNGELRFLADWSKQLGVTRNFLLKEGHNIKANDNIIVESGTIANDVLAIGSGADPDSKDNVIRTDKDSRLRYGLRQYSESLQQDEYSSVETAASSILRKMKYPTKTFKITALDVGDTWVNIDIGDTLKLHMAHVGFDKSKLGVDTDIRVIGMTYSEKKNELELKCEEQ